MCELCKDTGKVRARYNHYMPSYNQDDFAYCKCEIGVQKFEKWAARNTMPLKPSSEELEMLHEANVRNENIKKADDMLKNGGIEVVLKKEKSAWTPYGECDYFIGSDGKKYRSIKFLIPENEFVVIAASRGVIKDMALTYKKAGFALKKTSLTANDKVEKEVLRLFLHDFDCAEIKIALDVMFKIDLSVDDLMAFKVVFDV